MIINPNPEERSKAILLISCLMIMFLILSTFFITMATSCNVVKKDKAEIKKITSDIFEQAIDPEHHKSSLPTNVKIQKEEKKNA